MKLKRIMLAILSITFAALAATSAFAAYENTTPDDAVAIMHEYGFFHGTDNGFELDRTPTRLEAVIMAVRVQNAEHGMFSDIWQESDHTDIHNFTDLSGLEYDYVTRAVECDLINGISETEFGGDLPVTAEQYVTMLLRVLYYDDSFGNFSWNNPWELSDRIGLTDGSYPKAGGFTRRDMVYLAYRALRTNLRNSVTNLYWNLFIYHRVPLMEFPEVFQSENANISMHRSSNNKVIKVGEVAYGGFGYSETDERLMNIEVMDPSILRIETIKCSIDPYGGGIYITYTGLTPGETCIKATYAEDYGEPHAIAFINVTVEE